MSMSKKLNAKLMNEKLKRGWTTTDFANYLECSEDYFLELLEKTFSKAYTRETLARLKKNEKLPKKISKETLVNSTETFGNTDDSSESDEQQNDSNSEKDADSKLLNISTETLDALMLRKGDIESSLNASELMHKELVSQRSFIQQRIKNLKKTLIKLLEEVSSCETDLMTLISELNEKYSIMQDLNKDISEKRKELSEINTEIEKAQIVTIFVYNSGEIEVETTFSVEIPEANTDTVNKIISNEQAEDLTLKQIKAVAKLISLVQNLEQQGLNYELLFEEPVMKEMFNKFKE